MNRAWSVLVLAAVLAGCDAPPPPPAVQQEPAPPPPPKRLESLFPEQKLVPSYTAEESREIQKRMVEAAERERVEIIAAMEKQLADYRVHFQKEYERLVGGPLQKYRDQVRAEVVNMLTAQQVSARNAGATVLAEALAGELKTVQNGGEPLPPPDPASQANVGLRNLYEIRRWYHTNKQKLDEAEKTSLVDLTRYCRQVLENYRAERAGSTPDPIQEKITAELKRLEGEWWMETDSK